MPVSLVFLFLRQAEVGVGVVLLVEVSLAGSQGHILEVVASCLTLMS